MILDLSPIDIVPVSSKEFLDILAITECRFTLCGMINTHIYNQVLKFKLTVFNTLKLYRRDTKYLHICYDNTDPADTMLHQLLLLKIKLIIHECFAS